MKFKQFKKLLSAIKKEYNEKIIVVGGIAVVAHGVEGMTIDVNFLYNGNDFQKLQDVLSKILPSFSKNITMQAKEQLHSSDEESFKNSTITLFDKKDRVANFIGSYYPYEQESLLHSIPVKHKNFSFEIVNAPYLVLMKLLANRSRNILDVFELYKLSNDEKKKNINAIVEKFGKTEELRKMLNFFGKDGRSKRSPREDSEKHFLSLTMGERIEKIMDFSDDMVKSGLIGCANRSKTKIH